MADTTTIPLAQVVIADAARPIPTDAIVARLEAHTRAAQGAFAENTVRALQADTRVFADWCLANAHRNLPASPETVAVFVDAMAEIKAPATVRRYRSSIAALHRAAGLANPCNEEVVRLALRRMNRAKGVRQKQAEPLNRTAIERMVIAEAPDSSDLLGLRDGALVAVAYDTLLRRSELVSLQIEDLQRADDGSGTILVRRSKGDQEAVGAIKYLAPDTMARVEAYLSFAKLKDGPVFRAISKGGRPSATALEDQEVRRLFRKLAQLAGLPLTRLPSGHSTRVGAAQDMLSAGLELSEVMQAGSWKSVVMVARYGERLLARRGAARKLAALQNRG
jgi:integrase